MDISKYYRTVSVKDNVLQIEFKGDWTDEVVDQIGPEYVRLFKQAVDRMEGKRFIILADMSKMVVVGSRTTEYAIEALKYARTHNLYRAVEVVSTATTLVKVKDASQASGKDDFRIVVTSLAKAQKVVAELQEEL